jgi:hypothetical protein
MSILLSDDKKLQMFKLFFTCMYTTNNIDYEYNKSLIQIQYVIQEQIILKIALNEIVYGLLNKFITLEKNTKPKFPTNPNVAEITGGGNAFMDIIKQLIFTISIVNGISISITNNEHALQYFQPPSVVKYDMKKIAANSLVPTTIFNLFKNTAEQDFKNSVDELNTKLTEIREIFESQCRVVFDAWPRDVPYSYTLEELKQKEVLKEQERVNQHIIDEINELFVQNRPDLASDSLLPSSSELGDFIGSLGRATGESLYTLVSRTALSLVTPLTEEEQGYEPTIYNNEIVMAGDDEKTTILNNALNEYQGSSDLREFVSEISGEARMQIVESASSKVTETIQQNFDLSTQRVNMNGLKEVVCTNVPSPYINYENDQLSFINLSNSDNYIINQIVILATNIDTFASTISGGLENDKYKELKSAREKVEIIQSLVIESYRFYNTKLFAPNEKYTSILKKIQRIEQEYGKNVLRLLLLFPLTKQKSDFFIQNARAELLENKEMHELVTEEQEQTLIEIKDTTNFYAGIIHATVGQPIDQFSNWVTTLISNGIFGLTGPLMILFIFLMLFSTAIYSPSIIYNRFKRKEQPVSVPAVQEQAVSEPAVQEQAVSEPVPRQRRKPGWGPKLIEYKPIIGRRADRWEEVPLPAPIGGTRKLYRNKNMFLRITKSSVKKNDKKNRTKKMKYKRNNMKFTRVGRKTKR